MREKGRGEREEGRERERGEGNTGCHAHNPLIHTILKNKQEKKRKKQVKRIYINLFSILSSDCLPTKQRRMKST